MLCACKHIFCIVCMHAFTQKINPQTLITSYCNDWINSLSLCTVYNELLVWKMMIVNERMLQIGLLQGTQLPKGLRNRSGT